LTLNITLDVELAHPSSHFTFAEEAERHLGPGGQAAQRLHLVSNLLEKTGSLHLRKIPSSDIEEYTGDGVGNGVESAEAKDMVGTGDERS